MSRPYVRQVLRGAHRVREAQAALTGESKHAHAHILREPTVSLGKNTLMHERVRSQQKD